MTSISSGIREVFLVEKALLLKDKEGYQVLSSSFIRRSRRQILEWLTLKRWITPSVGEHLKKLKFSYATGRQEARHAQQEDGPLTS